MSEHCQVLEFKKITALDGEQKGSDFFGFWYGNSGGKNGIKGNILHGLFLPVVHKPIPGSDAYGSSVPRIGPTRPGGCHSSRSSNGIPGGKVLGVLLRKTPESEDQVTPSGTSISVIWRVL